ncbi:uncharacterized protein LOC115182117 isoform X3 [Salmo trutta]|uniref:uncharacterized protein LOC115182117 isoform X3 n=1 Tax=Salmo trutta TaxID=8032 RepID=UPI001130CDEB|nr:uncharacterized protein LOC115182117 isoform X3 [Salmo trutta]
MCGRRAFRLSLLQLVWGVCTAFEGSHVTNNLSFQRPFHVTIITAVAGFVAVAVLVGIIMRKCNLNRRTQQKAVYTFKEVEQQDIEPYSSFTRRDNGLYSTLQLTHSNP